ncbi:MAG: transposase [Patescibacteria group bacterium]
MLRKEKFTTNEYYHIYNRTLSNSPFFREKSNCERLIKALLLANSTQASQALQFLRDNKNAPIENALEIAKNGKKLVDVVCYVIMPDHYHLLLKERLEGGITSFIHRCNISVAKYINTKINRHGPFFESLFKSKHITTNEYLLHLSLYIHLNPLDFISGKQWRRHKIQNWNKIRNRLIAYPYSSLKNFLEKNYNDKILSGTEIIKKQFKNKMGYESFLHEWSEETFDAINEIIID